MYGWSGKILTVDLTCGTVNRDNIPVELLHAYLGGRGLGVRLMRDYYQLPPDSPEMPLIFAVGPLCGTAAPTAARLAVVSRSPLTNTIFDCSAGGLFPWRLKSAGLDALFITGQSKSPVTLHIQDEKVELVPAEKLWGRSVPETVAALSANGSVAAIGPAGENGVLFANIMLDEGAAIGRGGLGAVMGGKRLKAIVVNGTGKTAVADQQRFDGARADVMRLFKASPVLFGEFGIAAYGTAALVDLMQQRRMAPTENFTRTVFPGADKYSGVAISREYSAQSGGCYDCPIQCMKRTHAGEYLPDYETLSHFGALNGISSLTAIINANTICNHLGMDTISAAATLAVFGEARGKFPSGGEVERLLRDIADRKGDGELLSLGSHRYAAAIGQPELSMSVKGLELPAYDPRGAYGLALAYCTSNRGGCHLRAYPISHEILRKPVATDRFSFNGKARIIAIAEDSNAAIDSLMACKFAFFGASLEEYAELLTAVTGVDYTLELLKEIGRNIYLTERFYNCDNGFDAKDDILPERFFTESCSSGAGITIAAIDRERFKEELQKYYRIRRLKADGTICEPLLPLLSDFREKAPAPH
jgi:aldehyde:ferredoxin oxidoreductase